MFGVDGESGCGASSPEKLLAGPVDARRVDFVDAKFFEQVEDFGAVDFASPTPSSGPVNDVDARHDDRGGLLMVLIPRSEIMHAE